MQSVLSPAFFHDDSAKGKMALSPKWFSVIAPRSSSSIRNMRAAKRFVPPLVSWRRTLTRRELRAKFLHFDAAVCASAFWPPAMATSCVPLRTGFPFNNTSPPSIGSRSAFLPSSIYGRSCASSSVAQLPAGVNGHWTSQVRMGGELQLQFSIAICKFILNKPVFRHFDKFDFLILPVKVLLSERLICMQVLNSSCIIHFN